MTKAICSVCPHACELEEGALGFCRARVNRNGTVAPFCYGAVSALVFDPIEKKPFRHFHPGTYILSVGGYGCNMRCFFCQNYSISQVECESETIILPGELVSKAKELPGNIGIAYTYNEPGIAFEYVRDTSLLVKREGMVNVMVTNGYLTNNAFYTLLETIDAWNIDLKCFTEEGYAKLGGDLSTVKENISLAVQSAHVEVTTLIVPGLSDGEDDMKREADFLASLTPEIPLHLSRYFPKYKSALPPTSMEKIYRLADIAKRRLKNVYLGNL